MPVIAETDGRSRAALTYYKSPEVRARISEFLGRDSRGRATARFLAQGETSALHLHDHRPVGELENLFEKGSEIARSLWDNHALIADLDLEYVNFDRPEEAFLNPERAFQLQEPARRRVAGLLAGYGIEALHLLSGRGHHFIWQVAQNSAAFHRLVALGRISPTLLEATMKQPAPDGAIASEELTRAFAGLSLVIEFVAHRAQQLAAPTSEIPIELTAVEVGPSDRGREMISLDLSEYGDPLPARMLRVPFSVYFKPWQQRGLIADEILKAMEPLFVIPSGEMELHEALPIMRSAGLTAQLARASQTEIPAASKAMEQLIADYETSALRKFHDHFYSQEHEPPERWPQTYDRVPFDLWPACGRLILGQPNDLLLRPACIRRVVRILLALGWHPRHIAGLIRSKYERDFGWTQFSDSDPATRADFYVRIFAGLFMTGRDDLIDFNCTSAREAGICFFTNCNDNLLRLREAALYRRAHDKLARRPFNRLLLPAQDS
jgi:hypothetical protein